MPENEKLDLVENPVEDPIDELRRLISEQDDAVQILVRPLHDNPTSLFAEEIIKSAKLKKSVKTKFEYQDLIKSGEFKGRTIKSVVANEIPYKD